MNDDVMTIRAVAAAIEQQVGKQERYRLGVISPLDAARFHGAIQGAVHAEPRSEENIHPLLLSAILGWTEGPDERDLLADGNSQDTFAGVDLGGLRLMGGGQELVFHKPVDPTIAMWMHVSVDDVQIKNGRSGEFIAMRLVREFRDEAGEIYTTCRETFLAR